MATHSHLTGVTVLPRHQMASDFARVAKRKAPGTSTPSTALNQVELSTRTSRINTRPSAPKVVNVGVRDSTYVLDGLLYHESDLRITEHYTDTAGFTDHIFALMRLLGFIFAPRIRDLGETKLYIPKQKRGAPAYDALKALIGGTLNVKLIRDHWDDILRLAASIKQGAATASLLVRKLSSCPRQNGLAAALRELGRIERIFFILKLAAECGITSARAGWTEQRRSAQRLGTSGIFQPLGRNT